MSPDTLLQLAWFSACLLNGYLFGYHLAHTTWGTRIAAGLSLVNLFALHAYIGTLP